MSQNYEKFLMVLKKWPIVANRKDRDFGTYLREMIKDCYMNRNPFPGDEVENSKKIEALLRLTENKYGEEYVNQYKVGATGLLLSDLNQALSDKYIVKKKSKEKK